MALEQRITLVWALFLFLLALGLPPAASAAADKPNIRDVFTVQLPGHWQLNDFQIETTIDLGTPDEPLLKQRFSAEIALREATYAADGGKNDAETMVRELARPGERRVVRGIATSSRLGGRWQTQIGLENDPTAGLGAPLSAFGGRVLIRGSEAERAYLKSLQEQRTARERAAEEEARNQELARYQHQQQLSAAQEQYLKDATERRLAVDLPGFWKLVALELGPAVRDSDGERKSDKVEQKFTATVSPTDDLFEVSEKAGGVTFLAALGKAGEVRKLHGRIRASFENGPGPFAVEYENPVTEAMGKPLQSFEGRVVVDGGQEAAAMRAHIQEREADRAGYEKRLLEEKYKVDLAKIEFAEQIAQAKAKADLAEQTRTHQREQQQRDLRAKALSELAQAMEGQDPIARLAAIEKAIDSGDPQKQRLAIHALLASQKGFSGTVQLRKEQQLGFVIRVTSFDRVTGEFKGQISVGGSSGSVEGALHGVTVTLRAGIEGRCQGNNQAFSAEFDLSTGRQLAGRATGGVCTSSGHLARFDSTPASAKLI